MAMTDNFMNLLADHGATIITYIGLVDDAGVEISGGSYARQPVTWNPASAGAVTPTTDLVFEVPAGATVGGWRGFDAATGGTNYGGFDFATPEVYTNAGQFKLEAAGTGYDLNAGT